MPKSRKFKQTCRRKNAGVSLTELLVGAILLGISLAVVAELMSLCVYANTTLFRQFDAQVGTNFFVDRVKKDARQARQFISVLNAQEQLEFGQPKFLNGQTLILKMPIHYLDKTNDPDSTSYDSAALPQPGSGFQIPGYYVVLYEVVPDLDRPGEFLIKMSRKRVPNSEEYTTEYPELSEKNSFLANIDKQIVAKGLVGPMDPADPTGLPKVFSYVSKNPLNGRLDLLKEGYLFQEGVSLGINGVSIDAEIRRGDEDSTNATAERTIAVHTEAFRRVNSDSVGTVDGNAFE